MSTARPDDAPDPVAAETPDELAARRAELVGLLQTEESYEETLQRLADLACATIPRCSAGSVTLWAEGQPYTVVSTDDLAQQLDNAQYETLEGPCLDASRYGEVYVIPEMSADARWPVFADAATRQGIRSSLSLPLSVSGRSIGALNLYSTDHDGFDGATDVGRLFAGQASVAITNAEVYRASRTLAEQLQDAMASRAVIEQAKGVLMAEQGCTPEEAFALLRAASQRENVKLREIAERIVHGQAGRRR
ncbi:MAG TPA: GAF and ANTAR domain-containing protein [Frankiaceae bacterium]|nr:GAF and ANTAR domain-containing protein [Frankiaceae bacterium]